MKTLIGIVRSSKMQLTAIVEVSSVSQHPLYGKRVRTKKHFHAHNDLKAKEGDKVQITETKPISRHKRWRITKILK